MQVGGLDALLWALGFLAHIILCSILFRRGWATRIPLFTTLITANIVRTVVLYLSLSYGSRSEYFYAYWTLAVLDVALQLCVVYEMTSHVFKPLGKWADDVGGGLRWLLSASLVIAAILTRLGVPAASDWRQIIVGQGGFFSATLMSELFVGMIVVSATVGLPVKDETSRISQGLGVYSLICILIEAADTALGPSGHGQVRLTLTHLRMGVYLSCVAFWIVMLSRKEPGARPLPDAARRQLSQLHVITSYELEKIKGGRD